MITFGIYFIITLLSVLTFSLVLNKFKASEEHISKVDFRLHDDLREDLLNSWPIISDRKNQEAKLHWMQINHNLSIARFTNLTCNNKGKYALELIYSWLSSLMIVGSKVLDFSVSERFKNSSISLSTQEALLSIISKILCSNNTLENLSIDYIKSSKKVVLSVGFKNNSRYISLTKKQQDYYEKLAISFIEEDQITKIYIPNLN